MAWLLACAEAALPVGERVKVELEGQPILLTHLEDGFFAVHDTCLHRRVSLSEGSIEGATITCSAHFWNYDLRSGACTQLPDQGLQVFNTKVEEGNVYVEV